MCQLYSWQEQPLPLDDDCIDNKGTMQFIRIRDLMSLTHRCQENTELLTDSDMRL